MTNLAKTVPLSPNSLPQAGERDDGSLREIHFKPAHRFTLPNFRARS
jgi:hypothetical protein